MVNIMEKISKQEWVIYCEIQRELSELQACGEGIKKHINNIHNISVDPLNYYGPCVQTKLDEIKSLFEHGLRRINILQEKFKNAL